MENGNRAILPIPHENKTKMWSETGNYSKGHKDVTEGFHDG
jgi:hypothetical protein